MRIAFVTEGGKDFGMGHVFRTLTLANDLGRGIEVQFFSKSGEVTANKITANGFEVDTYASSEDLVQKLFDFKPDSVVFDYLDVDPSIADEIRNSLHTRIIIFDNETQANTHADTVINALITKDFTNRKFLDEENQTVFMLGPRYLILNKLFQESENDVFRDPSQAKTLLLAFGGSDPSNKTTDSLDRILRYISERESSIEIHIVLGSHFEYEEELKLILAKNESKSKIEIHRNLPNLYEHIRKADLVITSPGLTMFESLILGTHVIVMYQNDLQKRVYNDLFKKIGSNPDFFGLSSSGYYLNPNHDSIRNMQIGKGRDEVIEAITHKKDQEKTSSLLLRQVTDDDLKMIMDWRSNPTVYQYFYDQNKPLIWEEHLEWWNARSDRVDWIIMIVEKERSIPAGSMNCTHLQSDSPEVGLFVGETSHWGKSIGRDSVNLAVEWLSLRGYEFARARVMKDNERSRRLFESLGFEIISDSRQGEILYQKKL